MKTLSQYITKRKFQSTPEPNPKTVTRHQKNLIFVIHKHRATRLHYDLRLEVNGVLKSWAVPKGPSLNPKDKHLAIMVEDHPFEYKDFEGIIPKGNYGAGEVIIWDEGIYTLAGATNTKEAQRLAEKGIKEGHLDIIFYGKKIKGEFTLVRTSIGGDAKNWLLMKRKGPADSTKDVTKQNRSVRSNLTIEDLAKQNDSPKSRSKSVKQQKMPHYISPMLAFLVEEPFDRKDWVFEVKWDGYRAIAEIENKNAKLYSRNQLSFNQRYPQIVTALEKMPVSSAVLDGELVLLDKAGRSQFQLMQNYLKTQEGNIIYYIFDLLYLNGYDLRDFPLIERKKLLKQLLSNSKNPHLQYSEHIEEKGIAFFREAEKRNLEGIIGKDSQSTYQMKRSHDWVKIKTHQRQEVVIGGFTQPRGGRKNLGALIVGVYEGKRLKYAGRVGGGFTQKLLSDVYSQLEPLIQEESPFESYPKSLKGVTWVRPNLVCEVVFTEWTTEGLMRHPVFKGIRVDKDPKRVKREFYETDSKRKR